MAASDPRQLVARLVEAVNARDGAAVAALGTEAMTVATPRSERSGPEAVAAWAERGYDHIDRVWALDEIREADGSLVATGHSRYVWRDSGEVGDETPVALVISFAADGLIERLEVLDDPADAPP